MEYPRISGWCICILCKEIWLLGISMARQSSGSAGTGKTIVAIHRAAHLARQNRDVRVLLTTFSETLANALKVKLRRLLGSEPKLLEQIDVHSMEHWIGRQHVQKFGESRHWNQSRCANG